MKSTLVEPPPDDSDGLDEESVDFIRADSVRELAEKTNIGDDEVLDRVLLPGKEFGSYHILGFVAAGGMGEIYAARRIKSDGTKSRPVALKVIADEYANDWRIIERFKREARISKAIRSHHVARVYEFGESPQGHVFLAMELLDGEELFDRLHRNKVLSSMTVAELTLQILRGLHKIHKSGFVHRDIKPENIFLARDPETDDEDVKIIDFGVAKRAEEKSDPLLSVAGQIYGTPQYIAPEQAVNPDVDYRADLYSLGVVMYECLTGNLPFNGESSYDIIVAHQNEDVPRLPSSIDPEFADIVYTAMAKTPEERFQSAVEMGRVVKRWVDETSWVEDDALGEVPDELELQSLDDLEQTVAAPSVDDTDEDLSVAHTEVDTQAPTRISDNDETGTQAPPSSSEFLAPPQSDDAIPTTAGRSVDSDAGHSSEIDLPPTAAPLAGESTDDEEPPSTAEVRAPDTDDTPESPETTSAPESSAPASPQTPSEPESATTTDDDEEVTISPEATSELRNPRAADADGETSESEARTAQVVTGLVLGLLLLALLWAVLL